MYLAPVVIDQYLNALGLNIPEYRKLLMRVLNCDERQAFLSAKQEFILNAIAVALYDPEPVTPQEAVRWTKTAYHNAGQTPEYTVHNNDDLIPVAEFLEQVTETASNPDVNQIAIRAFVQEYKPELLAWFGFDILNPPENKKLDTSLIAGAIADGFNHALLRWEGPEAYHPENLTPDIACRIILRDKRNIWYEIDLCGAVHRPLTDEILIDLVLVRLSVEIDKHSPALDIIKQAVKQEARNIKKPTAFEASLAIQKCKREILKAAGTQKEE